MRLVLGGVIACAFLSSAGCVKRNFGEVQEFQRLPSGTTTPISGFVLPNVDRAFANGNKPQYSASFEPLSTARDAEENPVLRPENTQHVKVLFSSLNPENCEKLKQVYADGWKPGLSGVPCSEILAKQSQHGAVGIDYFLSPMMQATLRMTFNPESVENDDGQGNVRGKYLDTNCWATAYEALRQASGASPQYTVHLVDPQYADKIFTSAEYAKIHAGPHTAAAVKGALATAGREVKFGDLLIIRDIEEETGVLGIAHAAVFVDGGLLFERVANNAGLPMRLVRYDDLAKKYVSGKFEVRRPLKDFPHVRQIPGVKFKSSEDLEGTRYDAEVVVKDYVLQRPAGSLHQLPAEALRKSAL